LPWHTRCSLSTSMTEKLNKTMDSFTILIADRNPRVRDFLRRELISDGYQTKIAKDGREVLQVIDADESCELLILDLDMPHMSGLSVLETIQRRKPSLPVIIHTFLTEYEQHPAVQRAAGFWEKRGNNIDGFKAMVLQVLKKSYPNRFFHESGTGVQEAPGQRESIHQDKEALQERG
jgi:CheY-like chemotaxis protein